MNVSIVGTGYVGLVSGVCLAQKGHTVTCVDLEQDKVDKINAGKSPIFENGLCELLENNIGTRLRATTDLASAIDSTNITLIAVGTPFDGSSIDTRYIEAACSDVGTALRDKDTFHAVVIKSTVVPGTSDSVATPILERASGKVVGKGFGVGMNPEFLREGVAINDFMLPDRIVYGATDERTFSLLDELYRVFEKVDIIRTSNKTAEMIKYTANSLLATLISFSNEIGNLCADLGDIDSVDVMRGVHLDRRLSPVLDTGERISPSITTYLEAGCGFGGSCFPKDVKALIAHGQSVGREMSLLQSVVDINQSQPLQLVQLLNKHYTSLQGVIVSVLGLAFKNGTDDMRESPAIPLVKALDKSGVILRGYDPVATNEARKTFTGIDMSYPGTLKEAVDGADAIIIVTAWDEFKSLPQLINAMSAVPLLIDGRRMIGRDSVPRYEGIGFSHLDNRT